MNPLLIVLRLLFGVMLLLCCGVCCAVYVTTKTEPIMAGAAIGSFLTFACGIYFAHGALDPKLWRDDCHDCIRRDPGRDDTENDMPPFPPSGFRS